MRILVVEDEFLIASYLESLLGELGHTDILLAQSLEAGLELLDTAQPDFAVLDVNVGKHLVFPLAARLTERSIPFLFATAMPPEKFPEEWRDCCILAKPVDRMALSMALSK
jgi:DNA-binding response OmpR family regulator